MQQTKGEPEALDAIGDRLREERVKAGISQRELARRLGLSPSLISQLENGQSKPSVGPLYSIVTELGVSLDHVIRGADTSDGGSRCGLRRPDGPGRAPRHAGGNRSRLGRPVGGARAG